MGYKLRREIRDALPPGVLTAAERLLVLELADICGDDTREGWPGVAKLAELTDLSERSIQETMARVGRKWLELRVPLGEKDGRIYYAYAGKRTTYRFPPLAREGGATDRGSLGATDPGSSEPNGAMDPGERCDGSVPMVRQIRDPSPSGTSLKINTSPPPTPSGDLQVVEAEIVEEGEESTPSLHEQIENLVDDVLATRPSWKHDDVLIHTNALFSMLVDDFGIVAQVVEATAKDPTSAHPSRITASGNPHLQAANTALLIIRADSQETPAAPLHPDAHPFEMADYDGMCKQCTLPEANGRHRVGNQGGGYVAQRSRSPGGHKPFRNPTNPNAYEGIL